MIKDPVQAIRDFRKINQPVMLFGPPGVGKSQMVLQAADGDRVIDLRLSMLDPVDLRGMPLVNRTDECEADVSWARPDFIPSEGRGILLLDELNTAPAAVQNAALQLVLDRRCGPHELGGGWYVMACCNKASHKAFVNSISAPLRNRFVIFDVEPDLGRWTEWAFSRKIDSRVVGYLNWRPESLYSLPADDNAAFPSPRQWALVSHMLKNEVATTEYVGGAVGQNAAAEFQAYISELQYMPDIGKLLKGEETYMHNPSRPSISYAITVNLVYKVRKSPKLLDNAFTVLENLGEEFSALFLGSLLKGNNLGSDANAAEIITNPKVTEWAARYGKHNAPDSLVFS